MKWAAARATDLALRFDTTVTIVRSATSPSTRQIHHAVHGTPWVPDVVTVKELLADLVEDPPAVVMLACRGPVVEFIARRLRDRVARMPLVVSGIPGLWFPPTRKGLAYRELCDVLVVHSPREARAVQARLTPGSMVAAVGIASIAPTSTSPVTRADGHVVFAPQSLVPRAEPERLRLVDGLIAAAHAHPDVEFRIKVRGRAGEPQTHAETLALDDVALKNGRVLPANLVVVGGPLATHLHGARGLATVSSTAALESLAAGVPTLCLTDFGVDDDVLNAVFEGSGLFGNLDALAALTFHSPEESWLEENYFHAVAADEWCETVARLESRRPLESAPPAGWRSPRRWPRLLLSRANAWGREDAVAMRVAYRIAAPGLRFALRTRARLRRHA